MAQSWWTLFLVFLCLSSDNGTFGRKWLSPHWRLRDQPINSFRKIYVYSVLEKYSPAKYATIIEISQHLLQLRLAQLAKVLGATRVTSRHSLLIMQCNALQHNARQCSILFHKVAFSYLMQESSACESLNRDLQMQDKLKLL